MEIKGKVHEIGEEQQVTDKFKKRSLVLEVSDNPQFVDYVNIEFQQGNSDKLDNLNVGDNVSVAINIRGRSWVNKDGVTQYFNTIVGWNFRKLGKEYGDHVQLINNDDGSSDLPF